MNKIQILLFVILGFFLSSNSYAATTLSAVTQTVGMNFGTIDPKTGGTITSAGAVSGVKSLGNPTPVNASFTVSGSASGNARVFIVFLTSMPVNLTNGANIAPIAYKLNATGQVVTSKTFSVATGEFSTVVPVYGTLTVGSTQSDGVYSGDYNLVACACTGNAGTCPATPC